MMATDMCNMSCNLPPTELGGRMELCIIRGMRYEGFDCIYKNSVHYAPSLLVYLQRSWPKKINLRSFFNPCAVEAGNYFPEHLLVWMAHCRTISVLHMGCIYASDNILATTCRLLLTLELLKCVL
jgi:hypothetical protein